MKKILLLVISCLFVMPVFADEYYVNENGLPFSEYQYNVLSDMIGEDGVAKLSQMEYSLYNVVNMTEDNHTYNSKSDYGNESFITPYGDFFETEYKRVSISATCNSSYCTVTTFNKWKKQPATRSYDVIGVRYSGTNCYDTSVTALIVRSNSSTVMTNHKGASNGYASVGKLPTDDINYVSHTVKILPQGLVFGTYQHAQKTLTLANATSYTFSSAGLGNVIYYSDSSIRNKYDHMDGVWITLPQ